MPTVSRFFGVVIAMYFDGDGPPRFHANVARPGGVEVSVRLCGRHPFGLRTRSDVRLFYIAIRGRLVLLGRSSSSESVAALRASCCLT